MFSYIEYYENRELDEIDKIENDLTKIEIFDIYDMSRFEDIFHALRKDKYSMEYLNTLSLTDFFKAYYELIDRNKVESARYWFREKLRDIEQKCNEKVPLEGSDKGEMRERTDLEKEALNEELEQKYFKTNNKEIIKDE